MERIGGYTIVTPASEPDGFEAEQLVLDTNVLIQLRDFYFGRSTRVPVELKDLLLRFPHARWGKFVDINYGWAAAEASWVRGRGYDLVQRRRLVYAADNVLSWDVERLEREFSERRPPVDRDRQWGKVPVGDPASDTRPPFLILPAYGPLLFLLHLESKRQERKSRGPLWAMRVFTEWMTERFGVRSGYVLSLAAMLLAGDASSQRLVRAIFKLSGGEGADEMASKAWNVAWDVLMTSLGEGLTFGLLGGARPRRTALVTYDADPVLLRLAAEVAAVVTFGNETIPLSRLSGSLRVDEKQLREITDLNPMDGLARFRRDPAAMARQAAGAVHELETEMGVTTVTAVNDWLRVEA